ncbi:tetratricopeptide repeat protein [Avibacterium paragallinarum]|uniref:SEL1-like repeat protein n=1 Tax=Avibacterium paragallinarum TaxID=728 RepID=A0AAE5TJV2_AVIPA|nr:SEL1-like repeat protein [Avibacterium paragallinarum]MEE3608312.1 SEL1-like repeat protein [Avibacterium paragallinarum]MEE3621362.1 SEL1-like repeat protein [Avibacterium paragallinarum]MEE3668066.1 SEL1-like repeat protein [Avibacterium paragallinarum]MEE3681155.1 SEL1-like repeat protein [Avibacterium paragallinarum]MEE4386349.1 SEL1-like repeat protein [Avibacterium paragallinarum]
MQKWFFGIGIFLFSLFVSGNPNDIVDLINKAEQGDATSQTRLGGHYLIEKHQDIEKALYWYKKAAAQNQPIAIYKLGEIYEFGKGVNKDLKEAFKWYLKGAKLGEIEAIISVAYAYYMGRGIEKDMKKAFYWFTKATERGRENSTLGVFYLYGIGTEKDEKKAFENFLKASQVRKTDGALFEQIAIMYDGGIGTERDYYQAFLFYKKAAEKGKAYSQYRLAKWYYFGKANIISKNPELAFAYAINAAKQGQAEAQTLLGSMYIARKDYQSAFYWISQAENKDPHAQLYLGMIYEFGLFVIENLEKAKFHYQKACEQGVKEACEDVERLSK